MMDDNDTVHGRAASKKKSNAATIVVSIIMTIALAVGIYAGYTLWQNNQMYVEGDRSYEKLCEIVGRDKAKTDVKEIEAISFIDTAITDNENAEIIADVDNNEANIVGNIPDINIDFDVLEKINADSACVVVLS